MTPQTPREQLQRLKELKAALPRLARETLQEIAPALEALNVQQLDHGLRADGTTLPDYSPTSVMKYGKTPGPMTIEQTGAFKRRIRLKATTTKFELISTDSKANMLEKKYGPLTGLTPSNTTFAGAALFMPAYRAKMQQFLNS